MDVHRKNSSESSESLNETQFSHSNFSGTHRFERKQAMKIKSKSEDASAILTGNQPSTSSSRRLNHSGLRKNAGGSRTVEQLQRQASLDYSESNMGLSKLQRHHSTDSNDENQQHRHHRFHSAFYHPNQLNQSLAPEIYLEPNFTTKSELTIENYPREGASKALAASKKASMRKDSNSTMSAIQLATINSNNNVPSTSSSSTRLRRHSNTTAKQVQLPANTVSVRRIKSTALETSCASITNLQSHPNSVETIGGRALRNPLPPPSKSLIRNQHLQFFSKGAADSSSIDPVYPNELREIAELADEKSLNDSFILTESDSDDNGDPENISDNNEDDEDSDDDDYDSDDNDMEQNNEGTRLYVQSCRVFSHF